MRSKRLVAPITALVVLAGLALWLVWPALIDWTVNPPLAATQQPPASVTSPGKAAMSGDAGGNPDSMTIAPSHPPYPARNTPYRNPLWNKFATSRDLEAYVMELLNDSDPDSTYFAIRIKGTCLGLLYSKHNDNFFADLARERWITDPEALAHFQRLSNDLGERCGKLSTSGFAIELMQQRSKESRARGSVLSQLPSGHEYRSGLTPTQTEMLDKVLRDPAYAALWITHNQGTFITLAQGTGLMDGLNEVERKAVRWLSVCQLSGDCNNDSITRLHVCVGSFICKGNSVEESVANAVGAERIQLITERASQLAFTTIDRGARLYDHQRWQRDSDSFLQNKSQK